MLTTAIFFRDGLNSQEAHGAASCGYHALETTDAGWLHLSATCNGLGIHDKALSATGFCPLILILLPLIYRPWTNLPR